MARLKDKDFGIISSQDLKNPFRRGMYYLLVAFCIIVAFFCLAPILWVMTSSLKDIKEFVSVPPTIIPRSFHPDKIIKVWKAMDFGKYYINSLISVSGSIVCAVLFNGLTGYALSVLKPKGSKVILTLILVSLMVPATTSLVPVYKNIVTFKMVDSFLPLWLSYGANAFNVLLYKSFFDGIPRSMVEAARIDGCNDFMLFFKIILPLSKSINAVVVIFSLNAAWSDFILPMLVLSDQNKATVILKLYSMALGNSTFPVDYRMLASFFALIPPVILFILFQKHITKGLTFTGIKG
jgi:multiple sugar transport system permease protein